MGYNTWDDFRCGGINSTNVAKVADAIVRYGLDKVGYQYLGLDDCWATSRDEATGAIVPDPTAFPGSHRPDIHVPASCSFVRMIRCRKSGGLSLPPNADGYPQTA